MSGAPAAGERLRIDLADDDDVAHWTAALAVTRRQLEESIARVGPHADDVEMDLKGARSSTIAEQVDPLVDENARPGIATPS